ncbi:hypothetical protein ACFWRV_22630 [Streptomyces sp. NPDC058576]|uniref:hypothetical protein n=1 Tax=Streptomyces sp. NPDC058576 TaxID=3346547 RepID=UPI0036600F0C
MPAPAPEPTPETAAPAGTSATLSRRRLAQYTAAAFAASTLTARAAAAAPHRGAPAAKPPLAPLAPLPAGVPARAQVAPEEQRLASYLATLPALANAVEDTDPDAYGYITGGWWRDWPNTFNARVQENVLTMAWFHRHDRKWNPYHRDPALLARLDAALHHYLDLQFDDGSWPEYYALEHSRATTGFALTFLSATLGHLEAARALPATRRRLSRAIERGIRWFLDPGNPEVWTRNLPYTNHIATGLLGAAQYLKLHPDRALRRRLDDRVEAFAQAGLSPAGYFYEETGADVNYSLNVMSPDLAALYELTGNRTVKTFQQTHLDWLGHNLLREPDGAGWFCNVAPSTRTSAHFLDDAPREEERSNLNRLWARHLPAMAAYLPTDEDKRAERAAWRAATEPVAPLGKGKVSPSPVRDADYEDRHPTPAQKKAAIAQAPYLRADTYTEHRSDPLGQDYLFVRRPSYYAGSHWGYRATDRVRNGLSFWWHPRAGTVIHSVNNDDNGCWTTAVEAGPVDRLDARCTLRFEYLQGTPAEGFRVQDPSTVPPTESLSVRYTAVGDVIRKEAVHTPTQLAVHVEVAGPFTERVPLVLHPTDRLTFEGSRVEPVPGQPAETRATALRIRRGDTTVTVSWDRELPVQFVPLATTYFRDKKRRQHALVVAAEGTLDYRIGADG